jgi:hypothetical protein
MLASPALDVASPQAKPPQKIETALKEGLASITLPKQYFERQGDNKETYQEPWISQKIVHGGLSLCHDVTIGRFGDAQTLKLLAVCRTSLILLEFFI